MPQEARKKQEETLGEKGEKVYFRYFAEKYVQSYPYSISTKFS